MSMMANQYYEVIDTLSIEKEGKTYQCQTFNGGLKEFLKNNYGKEIHIYRESLDQDKIRAIVIGEEPSNEWQKIVHVGSSLPPKDGRYAMFVGRWQPLHKGHQELFKQAMDEGKNVLICIRDIEPDEKNPFSVTEVKANIEQHYDNEVSEGKVMVMVIPDISSIEFGRGVGYDIIERVPPQQIGDISATKIREQMRKEGKL